jgi:hypothetical protein
MPAMHAPFVQPCSVDGVSYSPLVFTVLRATGKSRTLDSSNRVIAANWHAPPTPHTPAPLPLRV